MARWNWLWLLYPLALNGQSLNRFQYDHPQMGTTFRLLLYAKSQEVADSAAEKAFSRLDTLNRVLSDYLPDSEINTLDNRAGDNKWYTVSDDLWQVFHLSCQIHQRSKGAFDVRIGPLSRLWRRAFRRQEFPDVNAVQQALKLVRYGKIKQRKKKQQIQLDRKGMDIDFGGIGKGFALDQMGKALNEMDVAIFLVDGGGDLLAGEPPPGKSGWTIRLPSDSTILIAQSGIASSGDTYQYLEKDGIRYSHLIDPRTGFGIQNQMTVTVAAPQATLADAWASAFSILPTTTHRKILRKPWAKNFILITYQP